ncbi:PREDICTED: platelet basic protein [Ceratotherium simum simum]|uniref:C-X-C motif chemokine n=1 Tax=Ceratotherium simum simum TaxID=73337 RepID=A0ABM1CL20_CERSS|nr:PREDICTED: platelet basic protein [Ceratotherium simum simum]
MNLRPKATSSCSSASPLWVLRVLLPLSLLLTALVPSIAIREPTSVDRELYVELRCLCLQTTSGVHPSKIQSLKVMRAGPHCHKVEVIATMRNGRKTCVDPQAPLYKKIIKKILESHLSAA